jgi:cytochrome c oxidase subunit 2
VKVHTYEKAFLIVGAAVVAACGAVLFYTSLGMGIHLPGAGGRLAAGLRTRRSATPVCAKPGPINTRQSSSRRVFVPAEIRSRGRRGDVHLHDRRLIHGSMWRGRGQHDADPGQISRNTYRFERPGIPPALSRVRGLGRTPCPAS